MYKRGNVWWYNFFYAGRHIQESAKTTKKTVAKEAEKNRRTEIEKGFNAIEDRKQRIATLTNVAEIYLKEYRLKHRAVTFAEYAVRHLCEHLGSRMIVEINASMVSDCQIKRLEQKAAGKSINDEVGILLRITVSV